MRQNIYIKPENQPIFTRALELAGEDNLSGVIAEAVRRFVATKEAEAIGMTEITLEVGFWRSQGADDVRKIRFIGRMIAETVEYTGQKSDRSDRWNDYALYQTQAGKYLVYWRFKSQWQNENDIADYAVLNRLPGYNHEPVMGVVTTGSSYLPARLLQEAAAVLGQEMVEWVE